MLVLLLYCGEFVKNSTTCTPGPTEIEDLHAQKWDRSH